MKKAIVSLAAMAWSLLTFGQTNTVNITFETPAAEIIIDTTGGNIWQIGQPQKSFFTEAHSATKAIMTDTANYYPPNDTSSFVLAVRNPDNQSCATCMEFWHQYDMDSLGDQGLIETSYDGGQSWLILKDTFDVGSWGSWFLWQNDYFTATGLYTVHKLKISGNSGDWVKSGFCWNWWIPVKAELIIPDSLLIRFTFISDSTTDNRDGWMIDDIVVAAAPPQNCSGIRENGTGTELSVFPNPFSSRTTLQTSQALQQATIRLYNGVGQMVMELNNVSGQNFTLGRDDLPQGLYFLLLTEDDRTIATKKLVISE